MTESESTAPRTTGGRLQSFIESVAFQRGITALILVNAAIRGLETSHSVMAATKAAR